MSYDFVPDEYVEFEGCIGLKMSASEQSLQVEFPDGQKLWVPISLKVLHKDSEVCMPGDEGLIFVSEWWAHANSLI